MTTWAEEAALCFEAGDYLRARGGPVTPEKVESFVRERAAQAGKVISGASIADITVAVNAMLAKANIQPQERSMSTQKGRLYAVPQKYWVTSENLSVEELLTAPARSELPETADEATALEAERAALVAALPGLDPAERQKGEDRILSIEDLLRRYRKLDQVTRRGAAQ